MAADRGNGRPVVLVADDDPDILALVAVRLERSGYEVVKAADGNRALELIAEAPPDLAVLDWKMPGRHGALVLDELKERYPHVPAIVLTAETSEPQRALAEALRAEAFIAKPFSPVELLEAVAGLLDERRDNGGPGAAGPVVLVADDDPDILALLAFRLERSGCRVVQAHDGEEALRLATEVKADLAVLDVLMPKLTGYEVTRLLRQNEATSRIPVILLTARSQDDDVSRGFEAGADDYIRKPFSPQEVQARVQAVLGRR